MQHYDLSALQEQFINAPKKSELLLLLDKQLCFIENNIACITVPEGFSPKTIRKVLSAMGYTSLSKNLHKEIIKVKKFS